MTIYRATDVLSAREGQAFVNIDGQQHDLFFAKNVEAKVTKQNAEVKIVGQRMVQHKTVGLTGEGSMSIYYASPLYRQMVEKYKDTGMETYFTMTITNDDPESTMGVNSVTLFNVCIKEVVLAKFDQDGDTLSEDVTFSFGDYMHGSHFREKPQH